jgi:glutamyl-tRNA reductase
VPDFESNKTMSKIKGQLRSPTAHGFNAFSLSGKLNAICERALNEAKKIRATKLIARMI